MLCISPLHLKHGPTVACGQCRNCRINHKLRWLGRLYLESDSWPSYTFVGLSYADEHLPPDRSVHRWELNYFLDKLRKLSGPVKYFAVGEYGDEKGRPHYHVIHFGAKRSRAWQEIYNEAWTINGKQRGFVSLEDPRSAAVLNYTLNYTLKKMTGKDDDRLDGRNPEFFSFSRHPPLGHYGLKKLARLMGTYQATTALAEHGFPRGFVTGGRYFPFFRRDRLLVMAEAGYTHEQDDHLQDIRHRCWFDLEEYSIYRQAMVAGWSASQIADELTQLRIKRDEEEIERKRQQAAKRAEKARRREQAEKGNRRKAADEPPPPTPPGPRHPSEDVSSSDGAPAGEASK